MYRINNFVYCNVFQFNKVVTSTEDGHESENDIGVEFLSDVEIDYDYLILTLYQQ